MILKPPPQITILMSAYNSEKYIAEAIESMLNQTFKDFEFLIINDGSTDKTEKIITSYKDKRIKYIKNSQNLGIVKSVNRGLSFARGKYIARMDADDISLSNRLEFQYRFMESNPEVGVCGSWIKTFGSKNNIIWRTPLDHESIKTRLFFESSLANPSVIIRKKVLEKYNLKYDSSYLRSEDYAFWIKLSEVTKLNNIPKVLLKYRVHRNQIGNRFASIQRRNLTLIYKQLLKKLRIYPIKSEMELHYQILNWIPLKTIGEIRKAGTWLIMLVRHNSENNIYPREIFDEYIAERWLGTVYLAKDLGIIRFLLLLKYYQLILPSTKYCLHYLIKKIIYK